MATLEGSSIERSNPSRNPPVEDLFALKSVTGGRTNRYIALGNILRAAQLFGSSGGEIAKFTLQNSKEAISGVVMPSKYVPVAISDQPVRLRNPESAVQYLLTVWDSIVQAKYNDTQVESYKELSNSLRSLMIPNLPNPYDGTKNNTNAVILRGSAQTWQLRIDSYRPNSFKVIIAGDVPKKFITAPILKTLIPGGLAKKGNKAYEMSGGDSLTDPEKIIALVKFLHKNYPATVDADNATFAREVMKVEFDYSESKKGLASRGPAEGGQTVKAVEAQVVPIAGITIKVLQSVDELPDNTAPADVEGMWLSGRTVYLIADNLPNAKRVQEVLAHEAIGHALLEEMLGLKLMKELVRNVQNLEKTSNLVKEIAAKVDRTQPGLSPERRAKEIVANMAERGMYKIGLVQRVIQAIRNWLRNQGYTISFSDIDIIELLSFAENYFNIKGKVSFPSLKPAPAKAQAKTQAEINRERQQQKREKAVGYFSRDAEDKNTQEFDKRFEEDGFNNTPVTPSRSTKDLLLGGYKNAKETYKRAKEYPLLAASAMGGKVVRAITYARNKNVWFGSGLERADLALQKSLGLEGQLRDGEMKAVASIAVTNALHAGHIASEVIIRGALAFNNKTQMFQAIRRPFSMANVLLAKHDLIERIGLQRATNMVNKFFEAKRSRSIIDEYLVRTAEVEELRSRQDDPGQSFDQQVKLIADIDQAEKGLREINKARKKVNMNDEQMDFYGSLDTEHPELRTMMDNWTQVNDNMIDMMLFSKIISKKRAEALKQIKDYVPWYRIMDDMEDVHQESKSGAGGVKRMTNVGKEKRFEDTIVTRDIDDIVDNMLHNVAMITRNSMRNFAANRVAQEYATRNSKGQIAVFPDEGRIESTGAVRTNILVNGRRIIIEFKDPLIAEAVLGQENLNMPAVKTLSALANGLRRGVTIWPQFQIRQLFMDAPTAALVSGVKNPNAVWAGTFRGFIKALQSDDPVVDMLKSYGIGGYQSYTRTPEKEYKQKIGLLESNKFDQLMSTLDKIGDASDYAQRIAVYNRVLKETGDEMLALLQANNVIDFLKRGSGRIAQTLTKTVSFMNAYAQQIDILAMSIVGGRLTGKSRGAAIAQLAKTAAMFGVYAMLYSWAIGGEDDYEELDDQTKLRNLVIPKSLMQNIGINETLLIPIHTSASFIFKSIPELTYNAITKQGTDNEMDNTRLRKALARAAVDSLLGPNPVPTGIKPAVEVFLNKNFFTGGTVTPKGLEGLDAAEQYNASTSELGKVMSALTAGVLNPIEADHIVRGLFGTSGSAVQWMSNLFGEDRPTPRSKDNPLYGSFVSVEVGRGAEDLFYGFKEEADGVYKTYMKIMERGQFEKADKFFDDNVDMISAHDYVTGLGSALSQLNSEIRRVGESKEKSFTPDQRRAEITDLQRQKQEMLDNVMLMRKEAGM